MVVATKITNIFLFLCVCDHCTCVFVDSGYVLL